MHRGVSVLGAHDAFDDSLVAADAAMAAVVQDLARLAREDGRTFVHGESGVGVGWLCRWAHRTSSRRRGPLVEVSAQATHAAEQARALFGDGDVTGAIDAARGGTLLVRCFEELEPELRRRVLEPGDHRLVATCYSNGGRTPERRFDATLLSSFGSVLEVPPLRTRLEDIVPLASCISKRVADANGWSLVPLDNEELQRLRGHAWPGNVRELMAGLAVRGLTLHRREPWARFSFLES